MTTVDLAACGLLPPLPTAYLRGEALELLSPLRFLAAGEEPEGDPPTVDRRPLARALGEANASWGHPAADRLAERLADPATLVVATGQQPGLFGGPLYSLSKAVAAARWAAHLEAAGRPAVAVFWVATEDHDFAEVSQATVPGRGTLNRWDLGEDPTPLVRVGERTLGPAIEGLLDAWRELGGSESYTDWLRQLAKWHHPVATFGEAFCRTLIGMLGQRCPLLLDAMAPAVKRAQQAGMVRLVEDRTALDAAYASSDERIGKAGFDLQVRPQPGLSPLFLQHEGARRRIEWRGADRFGLRGLDDFEESVDRLEKAIADDPAAVSPGVLARPAFQDMILGTYLQILGPGEMAYMAQAAPTYRSLGIDAPWTSLRPQALVLSARQWEQAEELGLSIEDLVRGEVDVAAVVSALSGEDFVSPVNERVARDLEALREPTLSLDASLARPLEKTAEQVRRALETFGGKVAAAAARRHDVTARRVESLVETVRPGGTLQERAIQGAHFVGRYPGFIDAMWDDLGLDPCQLHLIDAERRDR